MRTAAILAAYVTLASAGGVAAWWFTRPDAPIPTPAADPGCTPGGIVGPHREASA